MNFFETAAPAISCLRFRSSGLKFAPDAAAVEAGGALAAPLVPVGGEGVAMTELTCALMCSRLSWCSRRLSRYCAGVRIAHCCVYIRYIFVYIHSVIIG